MPSALVVLPRAPSPDDGQNASNEVGWAGKNKGNCGVEVERLDDGGEEVLEAVRGEVHVLHVDEHPHLRIDEGFLEAAPGATLQAHSHGIPRDSVVGKLSLFRGQPAGRQGLIGKGEARHHCDRERHSALKDKKPAPGGEPGGAIHAVENPCRNQASEGRC